MSMSYSKSKELYERAQGSLAGGVSSEFRKFSHPHPLFYSHGEGAYIWDVDGNKYLDFTLSQGPLILGHSDPHVLKRVQEASAHGQLFAGQHIQELELAEKLQSIIPCAERIRFCLSGSEAVHAALRLARATTGKQKFIRFEGHYHGWFDNVAFGIAGASQAQLGARDAPTPTTWSGGLPDRVLEEAIVLPWNDLDLSTKVVELRHTEMAAIITEPVMCNSGCIPPREGYLQGLRDLCDKYNILLIFDEVITGFRLGLGGAQTYFGVIPDLAVFGKAMASGYPISVLCGKAKYMELISDSRVIHAGTMNSGIPSIAAATATIEVLEKDNVHDRLYALGAQLKEGLLKIARDYGMLVQGYGPMLHLGFTSLTAVQEHRDTFAYDKPQYAKFVGAMQERGIRLIGRGLWYISGAHSEDHIETALEAVRESLEEIC